MKGYKVSPSRAIVDAERGEVGGLGIRVVEWEDAAVDPPLDGDEGARSRLRLVLPIDPSCCHRVDMV